MKSDTSACLSRCSDINPSQTNRNAVEVNPDGIYHFLTSRSELNRYRTNDAAAITEVRSVKTLVEKWA